MTRASAARGTTTMRLCGLLAVIYLLPTALLVHAQSATSSNPCQTAIRATQFATKVTAASRNVSLPAAFTSASTSNGVPDPTPEVLAAFANASAAVQQLTTSR